MLSSIALVAKELGRVAADRVRPSGSTLPDKGDALTPAFLEAITGQPAGSIRSVSVLAEHHGTAGRVRIGLDTAAGTDLPDTLFVKVTPRNPIQRVMMNVFELGAREVLFYGSVAGEVPVRVPRSFGVELDAGRGRNVMVLEDLSDTATFRDIRSPVSADEAAAVVEALADLHAAFWQSPRFHTDLTLLRARSAASEQLGSSFVGRVLGNLKGHSAEVVPEDIQRKSRIIFERRAEVDDYWARQPQTLCHGDTHLGNLFFEGATPGFLDWQATMMAAGIRDVSYFLLASVDAEELAAIEHDLVDRYAARLASHGIECGADDARTWTHYRASAAEFYVAALVTAGTSDRMQPPEISNVGVDRASAAMQRLDTFDVLDRLLAGKPG